MLTSKNTYDPHSSDKKSKEEEAGFGDDPLAFLCDEFELKAKT